MPSIRLLLRSGDRRTLGKVSQVVEIVLAEVGHLPALIECLFDVDPAIRMRAADALEKVSRTRARKIDPYASVLLDLFAETGQQALQWHLAAIVPRLHLSHFQRVQAAGILQTCLNVRSSIVRTFALQGLFELSIHEASLRTLVADLLRVAARSGTPAMQARSRKLLLKLEKHWS